MVFGINLKKKNSSPSTPGGDVIERMGIDEGIMKSYIPAFLYKPPFGYPRPEHIPLIRQMSRNPYVYSVVKTIADEAASAEWDIKPVDGVEMTPELDEKRKEIINFLKNPNGNKESFETLIRAAVKDICELDSGVWVKVFNRKRELVQLFARDGGTFLKNPDQKGYMGNRESFIAPTGGMDFMVGDGDMSVKENYDLAYGKKAAYFQYGWTAAAMPVPFGKDEVVYFMQNPRTDSVYGQSPVQLLSDIILTLVYGSMYNLDFYKNSNLPEGIIQLIGANQTQITAFKQRFEDQFRVQDESTGFWRKVGFKFPVVNTEAKFTPFQLDPKTMQIIEQQAWFTKIMWMCFGITADEMGFTENSNKAVSETQESVYKRKAVRPILNLMATRINQDIIPEFDTVDLEFCFDDYDLDEDIKKHTLYEAQIRMGIKTPQMVAEELGIDWSDVKEEQEEMMDDELNKEQGSFDIQNGGDDEEEDTKKPDVKSKKDPFADTDLELFMVKDFEKRAMAVEEALDNYKAGALSNVQ